MIDPLLEPARAQPLRELAERGVWTSAQAAAVERRMRAQLPWRVWIERVLLFTGAALCLAGVVFFFAANWKTMPPRAKFAVLESALLLSAFGAWSAGLERLGGQMLTLVASVFVGVFLAVFGQIYQTGADAYELFTGWALLILPWVALARFGALWMLWLTIVNVAVVMFWQQSLGGRVGVLSSFAEIAAVLAILNAAVLAAREWRVRRGSDWLAPEWLRSVLCLAVFGWLTFSGCVAIFDSRDEHIALPTAAVLAITALGFWIYRYKIPNLFCLAVGAVSVCIVLLALVGRGLSEQGGDFILEFFILGILAIALFGAAIFWLRGVARAFKET